MRQVVLPSFRRILEYRWPLLITLCIAVTAAFSLSPLVDVARPEAAVTATLNAPLAYDLLAPASNILDALTMLSPAQYWATFALCALLIIGSEIVGDVRRARCFRVRQASRTCVRFAGGTVAVLGIMLLLSRPMTSLRVSDPDLIVVDFHSHTSASHDGRPGFDAERNREWHRAAGFNAVYITDHRTFDGALDGLRLNPSTAGNGTTILPGVELRDGPEHPILIGVDPKRMRINSPDWREAAVKADGGPVPPILILSMPGDLDRIPADEYIGEIKLAAIEGADGSPRGIAQTNSEGKRITALANRMGVALVSGSDNHGWAAAAPAWSVLRIPGWRALPPAALDIAIRRTILARVPGSTQVISRRMAPPVAARIGNALAGVTVGALMFRTMNPRDRLSWLAWSWGLALFPSISVRRRRRSIRVWRRARRRAMARRPLIDAAAAMETAS
jgi:predicted metal-dependent phosphoesterase TrpH